MTKEIWRIAKRCGVKGRVWNISLMQRRRVVALVPIINTFDSLHYSQRENWELGIGGVPSLSLFKENVESFRSASGLSWIHTLHAIRNCWAANNVQEDGRRLRAQVTACTRIPTPMQLSSRRAAWRPLIYSFLQFWLFYSVPSRKVTEIYLIPMTNRMIFLCSACLSSRHLFL